MKKFLLSFLGAAAFLCSEAQLYLNELYVRPSENKGHHEYFELFNAGVTAENADCYTLVTYFNYGDKVRGFYVVDLPALLVPARGFLVGASQTPTFKYQNGTANSQFAFNSSNTTRYVWFNGALVANNMGADYNNIFYNKSQNSNGESQLYTAFLFKSGMLVDAFLGGQKGIVVPQEIRQLGTLTAGSGCSAMSYNFANINGEPDEKFGYANPSAGTDNGYYRCGDGPCPNQLGYWQKASSPKEHTPGAANNTKKCKGDSNKDDDDDSNGGGDDDDDDSNGGDDDDDDSNGGDDDDDDGDDERNFGTLTGGSGGLSSGCLLSNSCFTFKLNNIALNGPNATLTFKVRTNCVNNLRSVAFELPANTYASNSSSSLSNPNVENGVTMGSSKFIRFTGNGGNNGAEATFSYTVPAMNLGTMNSLAVQAKTDNATGIVDFSRASCSASGGGDDDDDDGGSGGDGDDDDSDGDDDDGDGDSDDDDGDGSCKDKECDDDKCNNNDNDCEGGDKCNDSDCDSDDDDDSDGGDGDDDDSDGGDGDDDDSDGGDGDDDDSDGGDGDDDDSDGGDGDDDDSDGGDGDDDDSDGGDGDDDDSDGGDGDDDDSDGGDGDDDDGDDDDGDGDDDDGNGGNEDTEYDLDYNCPSNGLSLNFSVSGGSYPVTVKLYADNGDQQLGPEDQFRGEVTLNGPGTGSIPKQESDKILILTLDGPGICDDIVEIIVECPADVILPVTFKAFAASRKDNNVGLTWSTATEINNKGFHVERMVGQGKWEVVGFVASKAPDGNSTSELSYSFNDVNPTRSASLYRLRQVDIDGRIKYSESRQVSGNGQNARTLVYPNPTSNGAVNIVFEEANVNRNVVVSDMNGRMIQQWRNISNNSVKVENLQPGMYLVRITDLQTGAQVSEKILVNKR